MRQRCLYPSIVVATLVALSASIATGDTGPCAVDQGGPLPDLIVDGTRLAQTLNVSEEKFSSKSCSVIEGCVSTPGPHTVLRFTTSTPNIGPGALLIGDPNQCANLYHLSECHGHVHLNEYSDYRLWTKAGYDVWFAGRDLRFPANTGVNAALLFAAQQTRELIVGRKQGFCVIDVAPYLPGANPTPRFNSCSGNQGLSPGWADSYDQRLDCQHCEIDNLKEGVYVLENQVNAEHLFPETNYTNNSSAVTFRFTPRRGQTPAKVEIIP